MKSDLADAGDGGIEVIEKRIDLIQQLAATCFLAGKKTRQAEKCSARRLRHWRSGLPEDYWQQKAPLSANEQV